MPHEPKQRAGNQDLGLHYLNLTSARPSMALHASSDLRSVLSCTVHGVRLASPPPRRLSDTRHYRSPSGDCITSKRAEGGQAVWRRRRWEEPWLLDLGGGSFRELVINRFLSVRRTRLGHRATVRTPQPDKRWMRTDYELHDSEYENAARKCDPESKKGPQNQAPSQIRQDACNHCWEPSSGSRDVSD